MKQTTFDLATNISKVQQTTPGEYSVTVTGLVDPEAFVTIQARNAADDGWDTAMTISAAESGRIGSRLLVVNSNGKVQCYISSLRDPARVKVRLSA